MSVQLEQHTVQETGRASEVEVTRTNAVHRNTDYSQYKSSPILVI